jgi:small subunit ribosomal protein S20
MAEGLVANTSKAEGEIKNLEKVISEAFCEIDKAVVKGILHKNNGARKKARCSRHKRKVLLAAGLWTPPADHPDHAAWQRMQAKKPVSA